ncbi:ABC transporter substrate-binding protein [Vibrio olivae]|uniref:ABC transporter substrate-binding protein n=1 Tax=Vibrio olivae TaxID=1243002 RepID=UPI00406C467F
MSLCLRALALVSVAFAGTLMAAPITVHDSRGEHQLDGVPQRAVVLNWDLVEQVLELGVTPIAAPNIEGYNTWVVQPSVPKGVEDIGTRAEPNLEKIAELKPDVIITAVTQKDLLPQLERIAPVLYYQNFEQSDQQAEEAIKQFKQLAQVFDKEEVAKKKLDNMTQRFAQMHQQLVDAFGQPLPKVLPLRFANETSAFLFTENSTTMYAMSQLGLESPLPLPAAKWGISQQRITELQNIKDGYVMYILPFAQEKKLNSSILWKAMPFVRNGHVNAMSAVWSYGGAMSILYNGEAITQSLLEMKADK